MSLVYFIRAQSGMVKIGTTTDLPSRLVNLRTAADGPLEVLATVPGGLELEKHFHEYFADDWAYGEWFRASDHLLETVARIALGDFPMPVGIAPAPVTARSFRLKDARRAAVEEARELVAKIAGETRINEPVSVSLARVANKTGLHRNRIRRFWHRELTTIPSEEMDRLRSVAGVSAEFEQRLRAEFEARLARVEAAVAIAPWIKEDGQ